MKLLRRFIQIIALPASVAAFIAGIYEWSFWWFVGLAVLTAIALADQKLGIDNPLDKRHFIPGKKRDDIIAGILAFIGSIAGFGLIYWIGTWFA